ncbi:MAG: ABC transporter permease [Bdellovibrionaceae bacterium]|nr:ABC transporter permease [Pseudobdellovibrionaceae bacterium]
MSWGRILALFWLGAVVILAIFVEVFHAPLAYETHVDQILLTPSWSHWFGTDSLGRDLFARLLAGAKISLGVGLIGSFLTFMIGFLWGAVTGWCGGWMDRVGMRITDLLLAVPSFALVAVLVFAVNSWLPLEDGVWKSFWGLALGIALTRWMNVARVTRSLIIASKPLPYVEASRALGVGDARILWNHIRPNITGPLLVLFGLQIPSNILYESFMSFIGIGVMAPQTSWGLLVQEGWRSLSAYPHTILGPSLVLFLTVWSLHVLMDGWRESSRRSRPLEFQQLPS